MGKLVGQRSDCWQPVHNHPGPGLSSDESRHCHVLLVGALTLEATGGCICDVRGCPGSSVRRVDEVVGVWSSGRGVCSRGKATPRRCISASRKGAGHGARQPAEVEYLAGGAEQGGDQGGVAGEVAGGLGGEGAAVGQMPARRRSGRARPARGAHRLDPIRWTGPDPIGYPGHKPPPCIHQIPSVRNGYPAPSRP
jgi:hypothetical protein